MKAYYADTDALFILKEGVRGMLTSLEESRGTLRIMLNQMMSEFGFDSYPQWHSAVGSCEAALRQEDVLVERLERLLALMETLPDMYLSTESQHAALINDLSAQIQAFSYSMAAVASNQYPAGLEEELESSAAAEIEAQAEAAVESLELSNLMAISKVIEQDYNFEKVEPVNMTSYLEPSRADLDDEEEE